jgi:hypothetical protein
VSHEDERRRYPRYPLQLPITLHRGGEALAADVINASEGGCLLLVRVPLEMGEVLEASIPLLGVHQAKLYVLRCQSVAEGEYTVATQFEAPAVDSSTLAQLSTKQQQ